MKRGVVMSVHKQHVVVMTADGEFLQAPVQGSPQIGEEITFEAILKKSRAVKSIYWYSSAAAIFLLIFLPLLFYTQKDSNSVVAYVSMDINPSVELGVDGNEKVRELRALNESGDQIIKGLSYAGLNVADVAASILERAKGSHYLDTPNKDIFITSMLIDGNSALKLDYEVNLTGKVDQMLRNLLSQLAAEASSATITTLSIPNELREEAAENGISSGKMAVYLMAKDEGYELELEQLKQQSIDKVTESFGGVKTIVDNAADTSKEKLKELVAREKEEKAKKLTEDLSTNTAKPTPAPSPANKPVSAVKPQKPSTKAEETKKPDTSGTKGSGQQTKPDKSAKPSQPNKPTIGKTDKDPDRNDRWSNSKDWEWDKDKWNRNNKDYNRSDKDNRERNEKWNRERSKEKGSDNKKETKKNREKQNEKD